MPEKELSPESIKHPVGSVSESDYREVFERYHPKLSPEEEELAKKEKVLKVFESAKGVLEDEFGVHDLSTIEGVRLRQIVEETIKAAEIDRRLYDERLQEIRKELGAAVDEKQKYEIGEKARAAQMLLFETPSEAPYRWLFELYGITKDAIPLAEYTVVDETNGKKYEIGTYYGIYGEPTTYTVYQKQARSERWKKGSEPTSGDLACEKLKTELKAQGHKVSIYEGKARDDFKEYLRRLREKSHLP